MCHLLVPASTRRKFTVFVFVLFFVLAAGGSYLSLTEGTH